jgi:endonuclease/exonuclease/phosphatase family metal-dependent hydrolase
MPLSWSPSLFARPSHPPRFDASVPEKEESVLRLLTLNLAHGRGPWQTYLRRDTLQNNLDLLAHTVRRVAPDIVALQEADGPSAWSGNFDHVATLASAVELEQHFRGDHNHFGAPGFQLASGTALLARHRLEDPRSHRFAECWRDTKGFVLASVEVPQWGELKLDVVSVHLDPIRPTLRRRQILQMVEQLESRENPLVLLGDLNCCFRREPDSLRLLVEELHLHAFQPDCASPTYPASRPSRRLDWILISRELEFGGYGTLPARLSDHLMVAADLVPA